MVRTAILQYTSVRKQIGRIKRDLINRWTRYARSRSVYA